MSFSFFFLMHYDRSTGVGIREWIWRMAGMGWDGWFDLAYGRKKHNFISFGCCFLVLFDQLFSLSYASCFALLASPKWEEHRGRGLRVTPTTGKQVIQNAK